MGLWGWLSGAKATETACNVVSDISSGIDMLFYTDEEKAIAKKEAFDSWLKAMEVTQKESTTRAVTRRLLAISTVFVFLFLILLGVGVFMWFPEFSAFIFTVIDKMFWIVVSVIGFYFSFEGFHMFGTKAKK